MVDEIKNERRDKKKEGKLLWVIYLFIVTNRKAFSCVESV